LVVELSIFDDCDEEFSIPMSIDFCSAVETATMSRSIDIER
jgi:hypothetical protein